MDSPRSVRSRTAASISALLSPGPMTSRVTLGRSSASGGWSHSCVTAVTSSPSPRANNISVADGTRETIRMAERLTDEQIEQGLAGSDWTREGDSIVRELELEDFGAAMAFVNA